MALSVFGSLNGTEASTTAASLSPPMVAQPFPAGSVDQTSISTTNHTSTSTISVPSITLGLSSASVGSSVPFTGSGFSTADTTCTLSGSVVSTSYSPNCIISGNGNLAGSFVIGSVASGSYSVTVTGNPVNDFASATLVVTYTSAGAAISLSPTSGPVGIGISVHGSGFSSSDTGCLLSGTPVSSATCSIYPGGTLVGSFIVANVALGSYTITAAGNVTGGHASASFTVTGGSPTITLNPSSAPAGTTVQVSGSGFALSDGVCSMSGGGSMVTASINCSLSGGIITGSFKVANASIGGYSVVVTGSPNGDFASAVFTITTTSQTTNTASTTTTAATTTTTKSSTTTTQTSTSTSSTQSSTSTTTQTTTQSSTNSNVTTIGDFSISSSVTTIALMQGLTGSVTITVHSLNGFSSPVTLTPSWLGNAPAGISVSIASPVTPPSGGNATSSLILTSSSNASPGNFTIRLTGTSGSLNHNLSPDIVVQATQPVSNTSSTSTSSTSTTSSVSSSPMPTSCPVSYALSNSEVAPLAEQLRAFRDHSIMKTRSGSAFMILFNTWYYSYSPHLTSYVSTHQTQRVLLRYSLYPLVAILYASYYSYMLISPLSTDAGVIAAGIVAASLLGLIYLAPIWYGVTLLIKRSVKRSSLTLNRMLLWSMVSVPIVGIAYFAHPALLGIATVNLALSMLTLGSMLGVHAFTCFQLKCAGINSSRLAFGRIFGTSPLDRNL